MNCISWNVRGFNNVIRQLDVKDFIIENKIRIVGLLETKVRAHKHSEIISKYFSHMEMLHNYNSNPSGRIWLLWDSRYAEIEFIQQSSQAILVKVKISESKEVVYMALIYASNDSGDRKQLWKDMEYWSKKYDKDRLCVMGDFNEILNVKERLNCTVLDKGAVEFNECIEEAGLLEHGYGGQFYTWTNKSDVRNIRASKIDRVFVNTKWLNTIDSTVMIHNPSTSDLCPLKLVLNTKKRIIASQFRFFYAWTTHDKFIHTIKQAWSLKVEGNNMFILCKRQKQTKEALKKFNNMYFRMNSSNIELIKTQLNIVQMKIMSGNFDDSNINEEKILSADLEKAMIIQHRVLRQKARVLFNNEMDSNSAYYYKIIKGRIAKNNVTLLINDQGVSIEDPILIKEEFVKFYTNLLGTKDDKEEICSSNILRILLGKQISEEQGNELIAPITDKEVKEALFSINSKKSPGPDGLNSTFYKEAWDIVGEDFTKSIKQRFQNCKILKQVNATNIVLIPKEKKPTSVKKFRPISCTNTIYKTLSKIISKRLKKVMSSIISLNQAAYIEGRYVGDNILVAQDIMLGYDKRSSNSNCTINLDIQKAYDSLNWAFLINILISLNLPKKFIKWIRMCVCTPTFSVCVNGEACGFFEGKRGLRQGDPLSPYRFALCMEVFTCLFTHLENKKEFIYHQKCEVMKLNHMIFAYDLLVFLKASLKFARIVKEGLNLFSRLSGLQINYQKSEVYVSGNNFHIENEISKILNIKIGKLPVRYLGVPLHSKKLSVEEGNKLINKILNTINQWSSKLLSYSGRVELIKSIIISKILYWSRVFLLPKQVIYKLNSIMSSFLWKGKTKGAQGARISWEKICMSKDKGGLGIPNLENLILVCLLFTFWRMYSQKDNLWSMWVKHNILKGKCVWSIEEKQSHTWIWKKLMKVRSLAYEFITHTVYNGKNTYLVWDRWLKRQNIQQILGIELAKDNLNSHKTVDTFYGKERWRLPPCVGKIIPYLNEVKLVNRKDKNNWSESSKKGFSFKKNFISLTNMSNIPNVNWYELIWSKANIPRCVFISWLAIQNRLSKKLRMLEWGAQVDPLCGLCKATREDNEHIFFLCSFSKRILRKLLIMCEIGWMPRNFEDLNDKFLSLPGKEMKLLVRLVITSYIYIVWRQRNEIEHGGVILNEEQVCGRICEMVKMKMKDRSFKNANVNRIAEKID